MTGVGLKQQLAGPIDPRIQSLDQRQFVQPEIFAERRILQDPLVGQESFKQPITKRPDMVRINPAEAAKRPQFRIVMNCSQQIRPVAGS